MNFVLQLAVAAVLLVAVAEAGIHGGATSYANGNLVSLGGYGGGHHGGLYAVGGGYGGEYGGHYDHYVRNLLGRYVPERVKRYLLHW